MGKAPSRTGYLTSMNLDAFAGLGGAEKTTPLTNRKRISQPRRMICWDGEGMNLSGPGKPQHYVLFGCSAETDSPLISRRLRTGDLLEYIISVGQKYKGAVHVAYSFKYDVNMIVRDLTAYQKLELHQDNRTVIDKGFTMSPDTWGIRYVIEYIPGKIFTVIRTDKTGKNSRVTIYDAFSFFARAFLDAAESILDADLSDGDRETIRAGKQDRGGNLWPDIERVRQYWVAEIRIMERMMNKFRDVMYDAGIRLTAWYGPGAIASFLIKKHGLKEHIQNEPPIPEVHQASKHAYAGGRFELFQLGRINRTVYGLDINSAYPWALSGAPSLGVDHGYWRHVDTPERIEEFGVYRIGFRGSRQLFEQRAMPLFHRDKSGAISFPGMCDGWYWSPEARVVNSMARLFSDIHIYEGWVWESDGTRPFKFLEDMYQERQRLGKSNIISMPYKLGPNSMYGKFAQQIGFNEGKFGELSTAPESHCLPLAGWITSKCRAELYKIMVQIPSEDLIAVETDGIFTTFDPSNLRHVEIGDYLGQWELTEYDEMMYLRNGIYHKRSNGEWSKPKARGLDATSVGRDQVETYLKTAGPGNFPELEVQLKDRFLGLGASLQRGLDTVDQFHCVWEPGKRDIVPGGNGKRIHIPEYCTACDSGRSAFETTHPLVIHSAAGITSPLMSAEHKLMWETANKSASQVAADRAEKIERDFLSHPDYSSD